MTPHFPETNEALYYTLKYFQIERIREQIIHIGGSINLDYLDSFYKVTLQSHKNMEREHDQNAIGSIPFIQRELFEYVDSWLNNWQFNPGFEKSIENLIEEANEKEAVRYKMEIETDKKEYEKTVPPGIEEGAEYEVEFKEFFNLFTKQMNPARKEKRINIFITTKKPDFINKNYLPQYIVLVKELSDSFRRHAEKNVKRFFAGQLPNNSGLLPSPPTQQALPEIELLPPSRKLMSLVSFKHLQHLFRVLIEGQIIEEPSVLKNLHEIMASNFETGRTDEMKADKLQKLWSEIDPKVAAYWEKKFLDLHKLAQKHNPNKIT